MSLPWNVNASMGGAGVNYQIQRSLRFRASASAYLNRTPASAGNRKTWTWSSWVKRGAISGNRRFILSTNNTGGVAAFYFEFNTSEGINVGDYTSPSWNWQLTTTQVFRDPSAWYHIVLAFDSTQATSSNRVKLYINGVQVTAFGTASYPSLNYDSYLNNTTLHTIGDINGASLYFDGYLAEVNFIDGQALTPASFGYNDPVTGVWQPAPFKGTYGTNGFYLPFTDIATTSGSNFGLGRDYSGNANYWNTNNISVTAGSTYDSMIDSPTSFSDGSTYYNRGNYAVLNPLTNGSYTTLSGGNLNTSGNTVTNNGNSRSSFAFTTGKWYAEFTVTGVNSTYPQYGIMQSSDAQSPNNALPQAGYGSILNSVSYKADGTKTIANTSSAYGSSYTTNDVIGIAIDADNGAVYFSKNGTFQNSGVPTSGSSKTGAALTWTGSSVELVIAIAEYNGSGSATNFGQRPFTYTPPTGFKALNTFNLPLPTIPNGAAYMAATLWTGDGINGRSITNTNNGVSFAPDLVWLKSRSAAYDALITDVVRGTGLSLTPSSTSAEVTNNANGYIGALNSNGFTVTQGSASILSVNNNSTTYVGWQWKAGGTGVTNTSGSITSTVSVSAQSGFSVVTYTGTGANATVGHGLGVAPSMIIFKDRTNGSRTSDQWPVYHSSLGATQQLYLYSTQAAGTASTVFNNTAPTSSVFSIGTWGGINYSTDAYVAYCFAAVRGYSAFGSYTGNGSSDGPFIYTGFRPRFIMAKNATTGGAAYDWDMVDTSRNPYNPGSQLADLAANLSRAEQTIGGTNLDILSNGFKMRSTDGVMNGNGNTIIYAAFAENPFNYSRGR